MLYRRLELKVGQYHRTPDVVSLGNAFQLVEAINRNTINLKRQQEMSELKNMAERVFDCQYSNSVMKYQKQRQPRFAAAINQKRGMSSIVAFPKANPNRLPGTETFI